LDCYPTAGLTAGQLAMLTLLAYREIGSLVKPGAKKPPAVGLRDSIEMVVMLIAHASMLAGLCTARCGAPCRI
jgi:hypothetical protein